MTCRDLAFYSFYPFLFCKGVFEETARPTRVIVKVVIPIEAVCFSLNRTCRTCFFYLLHMENVFKHNRLKYK